MSNSIQMTIRPISRVFGVVHAWTIWKVIEEEWRFPWCDAMSTDCRNAKIGWCASITVETCVYNSLKRWFKLNDCHYMYYRPPCFWTGQMDDTSTWWCRVPCSHQMWMHQGMQQLVQVQEGRLDVHNVVQVWWMLIRQLVHVAYGRV